MGIGLCHNSLICQNNNHPVPTPSSINVSDGKRTKKIFKKIIKWKYKTRAGLDVNTMLALRQWRGLTANQFCSTPGSAVFWYQQNLFCVWMRIQSVTWMINCGSDHLGDAFLDSKNISYNFHYFLPCFYQNSLKGIGSHDVVEMMNIYMMGFCFFSSCFCALMTPCMLWSG